MKYLFFFIILPALGFADCSLEQDLNIVYINGINTTKPQAIDSLKELQNVVETSQDFAGLTICFDYIHNPTQSIFDFVEVFDQKIHENFALQFLYRYYPRYFKFLKLFNESLTGHTMKYYLKTKIYPKILELYFTAPTIIVSHSQGNLIANEVSSFLNKQNKLNFANLQVANTNFYMNAQNSDYITSSQDLVIKLLGPSVAQSNIKTVNAYKYDRLGHGFRDVYLNKDVNTSLGISMDKVLLNKLNQLRRRLKNK